MKVETIVFDFGGVLIDWNPRHLYRKVIANETEMETFLKDICTDDWNVQQDRGRTLEEGTRLLIEQYPDKAALISMFYDRWPEMLNGPIQGTVDLLASLKKTYPVYGLTNWSTETFPIAQERYEFLKWLNGTIVSGEEKLIKPDPQIFALLAERFNLNPASTVFVDDNIKNIEAAKKAGYLALRFTTPGQLRLDLEALDVVLA